MEEILKTEEKVNLPMKSFFSSFLRVGVLLSAALLVFFFWAKPFFDSPSLKHSASAYELYRHAKNLGDQKKFNLAEKYLKKSLEIEPNFHKALMELGCLYYANGDFIKSIPLFEKAIIYSKDDKTNYEIALYDLGKAYLYEGRIFEAWDYLNKAFSIKQALNDAHWPENPKDPLYYVKKQSKEKFSEFVWKAYPLEISERLRRINRRVVFSPSDAIQKSDQYLSDNPGSRFTIDIQLIKASAFNRIAKYDKSIELLNNAKALVLSEEQEQWIEQALYQNYFKSKQYNQAFKALSSLEKKYPDVYSPARILFQKALIYKEMGDLKTEEKMLYDIVQSDAQAGFYPDVGRLYRFSEVRAAARERLFKIDILKRDYHSAYKNISAVYEKAYFVKLFGGTASLSGLLILILFIFSRTLFYNKTAQVLLGPFRLWHLWLFCIFAVVIQPMVTFLFFQFNFVAENLLSNLCLDPYLTSNVFYALAVSTFCVWLLKDKYKIDKIELGFVSRGAAWNLIAPLLCLAGLVALGAGYSYLVRNIAHVDIPLSDHFEMMREIKRHGAVAQNILLWFNLVIAGPVSEEIFFRVFLFLFITKLTGSRTGMIISALVFSFAHNAPWLIPYYFCLGLVLSGLYLRSKSIYPSMIAHALLNGLVFLFQVAA